MFRRVIRLLAATAVAAATLTTVAPPAHASHLICSDSVYDYGVVRLNACFVNWGNGVYAPAIRFHYFGGYPERWSACNGEIRLFVNNVQRRYHAPSCLSYAVSREDVVLVGQTFEVQRDHCYYVKTRWTGVFGGEVVGSSREAATPNPTLCGTRDGITADALDTVRLPDETIVGIPAGV